MSRQSRPRSFEPEVFGRYFLVDRIATGGMAEIFKAKTFSHGGFENLLVIKRILPHISDNVDFVDMFIDEAKISAALQHANVVRIYDFGKILENFFIAMECVDGKDVRNILRKLARQRTFLPPRFVAFIAHEACKGLYYAHTRTDLHGRPYGIVHRDVSPSNILVAYDADVKIVDFGIAKARSNAYQTRDGILKGKFEYMSPEQADGGQIDHRSDLFSLGICMYEMMTNRRLFKTDSELATIRRIQACDFQPPRAFNPDLPPELEAICLKALSRDPADRYASAKEMGDALRSFLFPSTTETLRQELREFMYEVFSLEMDEERQRLESGTRVAVQLREQLPPDAWEGDTRPSMVPMTDVGAYPARRPGSWLAGAGLMLLGVAALGTVALGYYLTVVEPELGQSLMAQVEEAVGVTAPSAPTGLEVVVRPDARILIDGEERGTSGSLSLDDLAPGSHVIRLEAAGHESLEETVEVEAGRVTRMVFELDRESSEPRRPRPRPAPAPVAPEVVAPPPPAPEPLPPVEEVPDTPEVLFGSVPPGAVVKVDNRPIGTTPLRWSKGEVGGTYLVEMTKDGHQPARGTLEDLQAGDNVFRLTLREVLTEPPQLEVLLVSGGWAHVYVDGRKLPRTAPLRGLELPPGEHEIRVVNEGLGIDQTETRSFTPGNTVTLRIK